ncbi:MAG TPA: SDR family oxidoreductase [Gemmatimonadales bacterium]|nr:SDR family oxidoreductase [Gemmatimonadales bacterium]
MAEKPTALVTGASGGIGLELARLFAKGGHDLILVARNEAKLNELSLYLGKMYRCKVEVIPADLSQPEVPEALVEELRSRGLTVDVLVNNAGFGENVLFAEQDMRRIMEMIQLNMTTLTQLTRLLLPHMLAAKKGRILNVASVAAFAPGPLMAIYCATKAYVLSFSEAIGNELKGTGVTVTALCPGPTRTAFASTAGGTNSNLYNTPGVMDAAPVAEAGYRACMKGKAVVIPGLLNKLLVWAIGLSPRWMVTPISRKLQERKME